MAVRAKDRARTGNPGSCCDSWECNAACNCITAHGCSLWPWPPFPALLPMLRWHAATGVLNAKHVPYMRLLEQECVLLQTVRTALITERSRLLHGLEQIPFLQPFPSQANFVLCRVHGSVPAQQIKNTLAHKYGIVVRHYAKRELSGFIRISVGKPEHTDAVLAALRELDMHA